MENVKLEILLEKNIKSDREEINELELERKFELELKNTNNKREEKRKEEKRREELIKGEAPKNKIIKIKNSLLYDKNIIRKDLDYKGNKVNINKYDKNNRNIINIKKNIYIIIMIFLNLIITNNNMIEYKFSNITLKIRGPGYQNILSSYFSTNNYPDIIYINGKQNLTITNNYYFNDINNSVNLIWNDSIDNCYYMFYDCSNIIEIDVSHFDTSKVTNMGYMFFACLQLTSIDVSHFNTSQVTNMGSMFYYCSQLTSIDVSHFNTSKVTNMGYMFYSGSQLTSIDVSHFDTSQVTNMGYMFYSCSQLTSIDVSHFDTSQVIGMGYMFSFCSQLEYINLKNFIENTSLAVAGIFNNIPDNVAVCLNEESSKLLGEITNKNCYTIDCSDNWKINQKKIVTKTDICFDKLLGEIKNKNCYTLDCSDNWKINQKKIVNKTDICFDEYNNSISFQYEYQGLYYENCINGNVTNNKIINYCQCNNTKCSSCSNISLIDTLCIECNYDYYEIENDNDTYGYKKCYKDPIGYYLDRNESIYKKCYNSCEKCEIKGNNTIHNCIECNHNYPVILIVVIIIILIIIIIIIAPIIIVVLMNIQ